MEERQILHQNSKNLIRGLWNQEWVRPYESFWSLINTYKSVNSIKTNLDAMNSLGLNTQVPSKDYYLSYGIFCNISSSKNDLNNVIDQLSPTWHKKQLKDMFDKDDISQFISKQIKFCPKCMESGYHSVIHQLKGLKRCPFHPEVFLVTYLKQMYLIGKQSPFEYNKKNRSNAKVFFGTNIFDDKSNFEDGTALKIPIDWSEIPEIEEYAKQWDGIRKEYDKIRAVGTNINDMLLIPSIGSFLLKNYKQSPYITIYNIEVSDLLITKEIKKRLKELGLKKLISKNIRTFNFKFYYTYILTAEMLHHYSLDEIEYKIYQIERGKDIHYNDEIGLKLLFFIYLIDDDKRVDDDRRVEDILKDIFDEINYHSNSVYYADYYQSNEICIRDLNMDNLPICAQYHMMKELIKTSWKQLNDYVVKRDCINLDIIKEKNIFYPDRLIYLENRGTINIFKY